MDRGPNAARQYGLINKKKKKKNNNNKLLAGINHRFLITEVGVRSRVEFMVKNVALSHVSHRVFRISAPYSQSPTTAASDSDSVAKYTTK
jgi:hypothetical protein